MDKFARLTSPSKIYYTHNHCVGTWNHCVGQFTSKYYWKTNFIALGTTVLVNTAQKTTGKQTSEPHIYQGSPPPNQHTQPLRWHPEPQVGQHSSKNYWKTTFGAPRLSGVPPPPPINTNNHCVGTRNHCVGQFTSKHYWKAHETTALVNSPQNTTGKQQSEPHVYQGSPPPSTHTQPLCGYPLFSIFDIFNRPMCNLSSISVSTPPFFHISHI